jgi:hypothetical protein
MTGHLERPNIEEWVSIWKQSKGRCLVSDTILGQQSCVNYNASHTADQPDACFWLCEIGVICRRAQ